MSLSPVYIVRVVASVFQALGLILTVWRIYIRLQIRRFWWEDAWAGILLFTGLLWMIAQWVLLLTDGLTSIIAAWFYSIGFTSIVTLTRMSILFSIIRIVYGRPRLLKFTYACVAFFLSCWIILTIEKIVQCSNPSWHHHIVSSGKPFCVPTTQILIFEFTTDCVAVSILVVLPIRMLWKVKLPRRQRRMILSIFASSVLLALGALFHTVGQILGVFVVEIAGINVEVTFSFFVCNLLVLVTYTYRFLLHNGERDTPKEVSTSFDDDFTTRLSRSGQTTSWTTSLDLTTADLSTSDRLTPNMTGSVPLRSDGTSTAGLQSI